MIIIAQDQQGEQHPHEVPSYQHGHKDTCFCDCHEAEVSPWEGMSHEELVEWAQRREEARLKLLAGYVDPPQSGNRVMSASDPLIMAWREFLKVTDDAR